MACKDKQEITKIKSVLASEFEIKDLGKAKKILGTNIMRDKVQSVLTLSHEDYLEKVLKRFNMYEVKLVETYNFSEIFHLQVI